MRQINSFSIFFFNDTSTTEIYTLSLHDALPIYAQAGYVEGRHRHAQRDRRRRGSTRSQDRKSTRLNSSHGYISYAVFCLKKKKKLTHTKKCTNKEKQQHTRRNH